MDDEQLEDAIREEQRAIRAKNNRIKALKRDLRAEESDLEKHETTLRQLEEQYSMAPSRLRPEHKEDWSGTFPWDGRVIEALRSSFHIPSFRPRQREVINAALSNRDSLVIMPTGGGKSLLYQLPALLDSTEQDGGGGGGGGVGRALGRRLTLVVSPLVSLSNDQVRVSLGMHIARDVVCGVVAPPRAWPPPLQCFVGGSGRSAVKTSVLGPTACLP